MIQFFPRRGPSAQLKDNMTEKNFDIPNDKIQKRLKNARLIVLVGGFIHPDRRAETQRAEKPRMDVLEMERCYGAEVLDFHWQERFNKENRFWGLISLLLQSILGWSSMLALAVSTKLKPGDVVYVTGEDIGLPLAAFSRLIQRKWPPIIMRMEQPIYGRTPLRRRLFTNYFKFAAKRIDLILCRTQAHVDLLVSELGVPPQKATFIPEMTDSHFFDPAVPIDEDDATVIPNVPYILSAGLELRDYETLIAAVKEMPIQLVIAAGSPWSKFMFNGEQVSLPENVLVDKFSASQMRELYRAASLVVVPVKPTNRACGMNVILEAWSMARPVVASHTLGLNSYILDKQTGRLVPPEDSGALQMMISEVLTRPEESRQLAISGRQRVVEELHIENYVEIVGSKLVMILDKRI